MPLAPGATLGPYQIDTPLGEGGMGEVYTARDTRLGRTVAIKVLPEHVANDPNLRQRFEREARAIAVLNHTGLTPLVVRSPLAGGDVSPDKPDLKRLARDAEVDLVLLGTLLRAGERLQVTAQLVEAPGGTVVWSQREQVAWQDIFQLQDDLTQRIVDSLSTPLSAHEQQQIRRDVPANAMAYEHYLRANQLANTASERTVARDLYLRCVEEDPDYAPAWARLGASIVCSASTRRARAIKRRDTPWLSERSSGR